MLEPFLQRARSGETRISCRIGNLEFDDVNRRASRLQFVVDIWRESSQTDTHSQGGLLAQPADQWNYRFPHRHRIFARLDVQIGHACWPVMDKEFRKVVQTRAVTVQRLVLPAHAAVEAVFAAKIGNFDYPAKKNPPSEVAPNCFRGALVQPFLLAPAASY